MDRTRVDLSLSAISCFTRGTKNSVDPSCKRPRKGAFGLHLQSVLVALNQEPAAEEGNGSNGEQDWSQHGTVTVTHWLGTHGPCSVCLWISSAYHRHRYPSIVIQQAIWLYFRFALSYRDVEDMLAERGIDVSYETVRRWALKFGAIVARKLRRGRSRPDVRWHLNEVFVSINGRQL